MAMLECATPSPLRWEVLRHFADGYVTLDEDQAIDVMRLLAGIVAALDRIAGKHLGRAPTRRGEPFWTDCAILQGAGMRRQSGRPSSRSRSWRTYWPRRPSGSAPDHATNKVARNQRRRLPLNRDIAVRHFVETGSYGE